MYSATWLYAELPFPCILQLSVVLTETCLDLLVVGSIGVAVPLLSHHTKLASMTTQGNYHGG